MGPIVAGDTIHARIAGLGICVPDTVLTSAELAGRLGVTEEWITSRVNIHQRHIANGLSTSDLGATAAQRAMEDAGISPGDVDLIIVATETPDRLVPSTACIIQDRLGLVNAAAFDLNAACSGFVYALTVGSQFIASGACKNVLVLGAEVLSPFADWSDEQTCILFGDGAGAAVLQPTGPDNGILAWNLGADGSGRDVLTILAGGSEMPITHQAIDEKLHLAKMNGQEVFIFAMRKVPAITEQVLAAINLCVEDVDLFVPHQANSHIIEAVARRLGLDPEKVMMNLDHYGNVAAASVPLALYEARQTGRVKPGDLIVLAGFGAGLTWWAIVIRW